MLLILGFAVIVTGCKHHDKINKKINYDDLYLDYNVTAEEGDENVTCVFQYKNGVEGKAVNIDPAEVELDGQKLETDSARLSGFYYEVQKPIDSFAGKHIVVFVTPEEKKYQNEFMFSPFELEEELPEKINRKPFVIQLKNFPSDVKSVRLLMLDTSFKSEGFNDLVPVVDGKINIDQSILKTVQKGPINFELYMEEELPLKQTTKAGGKISITYGLKREFELVD